MVTLSFWLQAFRPLFAARIDDRSANRTQMPTGYGEAFIPNPLHGDAATQGVGHGYHPHSDVAGLALPRRRRHGPPSRSTDGLPTDHRRVR
jgi:hypothetical protein